MKKLNFLLIILAALVTQSAFSQETWISLNGSGEQFPAVQIEQQDMNGMVINITIPGLFSTDVIHDGITYKELRFEAWQTLHETGFPELPVISEVLTLPGDKLVRVKILETESVTLDNMLVYPSQTPSKDITDGKYTGFDINEDFYASDIPFPEVMANTNNPGIWRDVKVSGLHICPFQYKANSQELEVMTSMRLQIDFYGTDTEVVLNRSKDIPQYFYEMYEAATLNFSSMGYSVKSTRSNNDIKYLIITNSNPVATLQPFIDWKNRQGFPVEVKVIESGFSTPQEFKDYISQLYTSDGLEYVLMVGDAYPNGGNNGGPDDVPMYWWAPSGEDPSYSDSWYTCLDGADDHYADLAIGRFTYDNLGELDVQLQKTLNHYQAPDNSTNWAENTLLVAHDEQYPQKYTQCKNEIEAYSYALQTPIFTECYGGAGASNSTIVDYVNNNSCGIFNYRGHGSATEFWQWSPSGSFTNTHVQQLTNEDRLFVLFDVCCDNMDIVAHPGDCLCESFMKSPVASVAINGAIIPSYTIPNHDYDKEMYKAVFHDGIYNIGFVTNFANVTVLNVHGDIGRSNVRTYLWLGDASLEPWTLQPANLQVDHMPTLFLGFTEFEVLVEDNGNPVEGARVCITDEDLGLYAIAFTNSQGIAMVNFSASVTNPGTATIVVSSHNYIPYIMDIPILPQQGSYLLLDDVDVDDKTGNDNGQLDFMEFASLNVTLENIGLDTGKSVMGTISTLDQYVTIVDNSGYWGNIAGNSLSTSDSAFSIQVADEVPDGHFVEFEIEINDLSDGQWIETFELQLGAPIINIKEVMIDDATGNDNGRLDPGETVTIKVKNNNLGHCAAADTWGTLQSTSPYLIFHNDQDSLGSLGMLGYKFAEFVVEVEAGAPDGLFYADFSYELASAPFSETIEFSKKIGIIVEDWETNGFTSFNWSHGGLHYWETNMVYPFEGDYDAQSGNANDGQSSQLLLSTEIMFSDTIHFFAKTSSEVNDKLKFYLDGSLKGEWSGIGNGWILAKFPVSEGVHTFKWAYEKDGVLSSGDDCAWLDFIEFPPLMTLTAFAGYDAMICEDDTYQCDGQAWNFETLEWITSGTGTFNDASILDPVYTPSSDDLNNGYVTLTLEATDVNLETATDNMYLNFRTAPLQAEMPAGPDFVNLYYNSTSEYTTAPVEFADYYEWSVNPVEAGNIDGMGTIGTMNWNQSFLGTATITVRAMNSCGDGESSEGYAVTVDNYTSVEEFSDENELAIFPNPNKGEFTLELIGKDYGQVEIRIYDISGTLVYHQTSIEADQGFSEKINMTSYPQGMYFVKVSHRHGTLVKKILLNK